MNAKTLMIQGTTSDAGKSTLVAGLCRVLMRHGVRVAPFKPQNMALNSAVTVDGGEIGRAQAVQAQACGLEPHSDMNPILLKPNSDVGTQVIVHGRAVGNMQARAYHDYKTIAMDAVLESYARLRAQYDVILVEGAGSPAEINLRDRDIANMGFAEAVDSPVLLIADIDRGGVFAHLVGTLALLSASEQARVVGFVINRFRGDQELLDPGLAWLTEYTSKPVVGVLPYLRGLHLEAEDALPRASGLPERDTHASLRIGRSRHPRPPLPARPYLLHPWSRASRDTHASLRIAVPALPRISNHTDFDALRLHPQVDFHYIGPGEQIPPVDLIILPGSKSVRADLAWLRSHGWEQALQRHLRYGGKLLGVCGGFQMLGVCVYDPLGLEGPAGDSKGLGFLNVSTTLARDKQLHQVCGTLLLDNAPVTGYEIHHGVTHGPALQHPLVQLSDSSDGAISDDGRVIGTYLHGLFDSPPACAALLRWAGLQQVVAFDYPRQREADIERLADAVEQHLDMRHIASLLGLDAGWADKPYGNKNNPA